MVGVVPSYAIFFGRATKYGIFVPSFDVASSCSTKWVEASNLGAMVLVTTDVPASASTCTSVVGARKPVTVRNASLLLSSADTTSRDELSGRSRRRRDQRPPASGA